MKEIKEVLKEAAAKLDNDEKFFFSVKFTTDSDFKKKFLKEFKSYQFKEIVNGIMMSKDLDNTTAEKFDKDFKAFSLKYYEIEKNTGNDFFNSTVKFYKEETAYAEKINSRLREDKIEQMHKMAVYENNVKDYHEKLKQPDFSKKYINEITQFIKDVTDSSEFEALSGKKIEEVIKDIYNVAKLIADKNVYDFSVLSNFSIAIKSTLYNAYSRTTLEDSIPVDAKFAIEGNDSIETRGFNIEKLNDVIKTKYIGLETIKATKYEHEVAELEDKLTQKQQTSESLMKGFTFSKGRYQYSNENPFETIIREVSKAAINEVKVKRSNEIYNHLNNESKNMTMKDVNSYLKTFLADKRFILREDWKTQFEELTKTKNKSTKKIKRAI